MVGLVAPPWPGFSLCASVNFLMIMMLLVFFLQVGTARAA